MEMHLYGRRLSLSRVAILLVSMSLILYLFYDFMSFKSKPDRGVNLLQGSQLKKMQEMKDRLRHSDVDDKIDKYGTESNNYRTVNDAAKEKERERVDDNADDGSDEDFLKDGESEDLLEEKIKNKNGNDFEIGQKSKKETDDVNDDDDEEDDDDDDDDDEDDDDDDDDDDNVEVGVVDDNTKAIVDEKAKDTAPVIDKSVKKKLNAFRQALEYEGHLRETNATFTRIINKAKYISLMAPVSNFILVNFVCKSCLPFVNSWLCNTKYFNLHKSVLFVARDLSIRRSLLNSWPDLNVVALQPSLSKGDYADIRKDKDACVLRKLQLINGLLRAGINLLVFDEKSVWFENPVPNLSPSIQFGVDIIVNIVPNSHLNTGFLVLYATERTRLFWKYLYGNMRMEYINEKENNKRKEMNLEDRYEEKLQSMIKYRHDGVTVRQLPVNLFTDGVWYFLKQNERAATRPVVIRNNYIEGNEAKIQRAKQWGHWFLFEDSTCNTKLVKKIVNIHV